MRKVFSDFLESTLQKFYISFFAVLIPHKHVFISIFFCRILRLSQNEGHNKSFMPYKAAKQPCLLSLLITAKPYCRDASKNSYWRFIPKDYWKNSLTVCPCGPQGCMDMHLEMSGVCA